MAIARKPKTTRPATAPRDETAIMRVIEQGGSAPVAKEQAAKVSKSYQHPLKFPADGDIWQRLEGARKGTAVKLPRNTWILQAINEKLEREGY